VKRATFCRQERTSAAAGRPNSPPEREKAHEHYRRFIELWQAADPELQPLLDAARRKLAQVGAEAAVKSA
jgi:hypothetical protein